MNNTEKLLRAFIEASGFELEILLDYKERKMPKSEAMRHNVPFKPTEYCLVCKAGSELGAELDIDKDGLYTARLRDPVIDYKATKKKALVNRDDLCFIYSVTHLIDGKSKYIDNNEIQKKVCGILNKYIEAIDEET